MSRDKPQPPLREIALITVPRSGILQVTFLAQYRGLWTHFQPLPGGGGRPWHCCSPSPCRSPAHKNGTTWKGYAPVLWLDTHDGTRKIPAVLEVTERMRLHLGDEPLRGSVWNLQRRPYRGKSEEINATWIRDLDPRILRSDIMVQPVVERIYREVELIWDRAPLYSPPQMVEIEETSSQLGQHPEAVETVSDPVAYDASKGRAYTAAMVREGKMLPEATGKGGRS